MSEEWIENAIAGTSSDLVRFWFLLTPRPYFHMRVNCAQSFWSLFEYIPKLHCVGKPFCEEIARIACRWWLLIKPFQIWELFFWEGSIAHARNVSLRCAKIFDCTWLRLVLFQSFWVGRKGSEDNRSCMGLQHIQMQKFENLTFA